MGNKLKKFRNNQDNPSSKGGKISAPRNLAAKSMIENNTGRCQVFRDRRERRMKEEDCYTSYYEDGEFENQEEISNEEG